MLVVGILDPEAVRAKHFVRKNYANQFELLLKRIESNGLFIADKSQLLISRTSNLIGKLHTNKGQKIGIIWQELLKGRRVIESRFEISKINGTSQWPLVSYQLCGNCHFDAFWTSENGKRILSEGGIVNDKIVDVMGYQDSEFDERGRNFLEFFPSIDTISKQELHDALARVLRYTRTLRLYDKQIGKGNNLQSFLLGIRYLFDIWMQECHFDINECNAEIYTCTATVITRKDTKKKQSEKQVKINTAAQNVKSQLFLPLKNNYSIPIDLFLIEDQEHRFHARHLQTESTIISVDKGFDFFNKKRKITRNFLRIDRSAATHLLDWRNIPPIFHF